MSNTPEEKALLSLAQSTEGRAWTFTVQGWKVDSGVPVCDWEGVTCRINMDGSDAVVGAHAVVAEVSLPDKGLTGTIPTELGLLKGIESLTLKNNMLRGSIPQEVANLKKLVTLDLTECFLTGTLPQRFESPNLTTLNLANNAISGRFFQTPGSPHLQSIQEIRMENNLLTGTLYGPSMMKMQHIETLSLSENDLWGLIPGGDLGSLPTLRYLYLDSNHFVGPLPSQLAQVGKAQILELWVQDNALSGTVPASYVRFDKMHDFFIDGNKLTGALPPELCGPEINADFFTNIPPEAERNYCDSIACPAGSVAFEGVYPCEKCPGGEAARLKNRYLGQTGKCDDYSQRDVMKIFHDATTKGGPWLGVSDWDDEMQPVCHMTGITCDAHGNVVEINLKNRHLEGHIPDEIGFLSFLESLDVSDNSLMGYVPSDLQWTSITKLDISGNKIRGIIPPMLCMMEELNGNGEDNVFYCDRIACPEGTYNSFGFHHGINGETCKQCYDDHPFIAQKVCQQTYKPDSHFFPMPVNKEMGIPPSVGVMIFSIALATIILLCCAVKHIHSNPHSNSKEHVVGTKPEDSGQVYNYNEGEESDVVDYASGEPGHPRYQDMGVYRDFITSDDNGNAESKAEGYIIADYSHDDDSTSRVTTTSRRSATELVSEHQGMVLNRREKLKKALSERMSGDFGRRARDTASSITVGARRLTSTVRRKSSEEMLSLEKDYYPDGEDEASDDENLCKDVELVNNTPRTSTSGNMHNRKKLQPSDLLDVPMIT